MSGSTAQPTRCRAGRFAPEVVVDIASMVVRAAREQGRSKDCISRQFGDLEEKLEPLRGSLHRHNAYYSSATERGRKAIGWHRGRGIDRVLDLA